MRQPMEAVLKKFVSSTCRWTSILNKKFHDELVCATRDEPNSNLEFYQRDVAFRIWINGVHSGIVFQPGHPDTDSSLHDEHVIARVRSRICILYSTSEMSQVECCHLRNLQVAWSQSFQVVIKVAQKLDNTVQPRQTYLS